jgi:23S rRNA pseudouridine1911/1915/1917 synthase
MDSNNQSLFLFTVIEQDVGQRLDQFLTKNIPESSRSALGKLIRSGLVLVDDGLTKAGYRVRTGNRIKVSVPPPEPVSLVPRQIDFPVLFEDDSLLVLSKPPGLVVHPACGHTDYTLVHGLLYHYKDLPEREKLRPGIVHRLDKDTSGIMLVAKTGTGLWKLSDDFKNRKIKKTYHALL